ncbi:hypothetical protein AB670_03916 [Chryseobacterium sp. MOF25P]|nr:hypothetical protein AB670_03916 [Chryseobacterium sp. MOF25P]OBW45173.1 hypothetical protein AB671_02732 [Chryseobacterium sp. BGARF1]
MTIFSHKKTHDENGEFFCVFNALYSKSPQNYFNSKTFI